MKATKLDKGGFRAAWLIVFEMLLYGMALTVFIKFGLLAAFGVIALLIAGIMMAQKFAEHYQEDYLAIYADIRKGIKPASVPYSEYIRRYFIVVPAKEWHMPLPKVHIAIRKPKSLPKAVRVLN